MLADCEAWQSQRTGDLEGWKNMSDGTGYMWEKWPRVEIANLRVSDEKGSGEAWFSVWL